MKQKISQNFFRIAGITIKVECDENFGEVKFKPELLSFAASGPGSDVVTLRHTLGLPDISGWELGPEIYRRAPWAISVKDDMWFYRGISPDPSDDHLHRLAIFTNSHSDGIIYSPFETRDAIQLNGFDSLSLFPTDQIWISPLLVDRNALLIHSASAIINGQGFLFVGHSGAGKSTTMEMLKKAAQSGDIEVEILCDDRNIVRKSDKGWRVYGTWSHGDVSDVSAADAPLYAVCFIEQSCANDIQRIHGGKEAWKRMLATLIRPAVTAEWWNKNIDTLEIFVNESKFYTMSFDRSGAIVHKLKSMV